MIDKVGPIGFILFKMQLFPTTRIHRIILSTLFSLSHPASFFNILFRSMFITQHMRVANARRIIIFFTELIMVDLCLDLRYCLLHFNRRIHSYSEAFLSMFFFLFQAAHDGLWRPGLENRFKLFLSFFTCLHTLHFFSIPSSNKSKYTRRFPLK